MSGNFLITGGAGFIGSHLVESLLPKAKEIYIIDNLIRTNSLRNLEYCISDHGIFINRINFLEEDISKIDFSHIFRNIEIDSVYHLAATRINRCVKYPREGHEYITDGGYNIIEFCSERKIKLFFASSASVYQSPKRLPILETDHCVPPTLYGAGKYYTENIIKAHNVKHIIHRFFSVYGVRMDNEGVYTEVVFNWLNAIKNGQTELTVFGDPDEKIIDLVYVSDVVDAINLTMEKKENEIFNVSTETGVTLRKLVNVISEITGVNVKIKTVPENRTDIEKARIGDTTKLKNLGWSPKISLEQGIKKTWDWINTLKENK